MLDKSIVCSAISLMQEFHSAVQKTYNEFGLDLLDNLGRRNIVMSQAQEAFVAQQLQQRDINAVCDGRVGAADIYLPAFDREIECKLTTRNRSGSIHLQADYETLSKKGTQDFLYFIADDEFEKFCVLYFEGLTCDDFFPPSPGSRNKSRVNKTTAMNKCQVLTGKAIDMRKKNIERNLQKLVNCKTPTQVRKVTKSLDYWQRQGSRWKFQLERL